MGLLVLGLVKPYLLVPAGLWVAVVRVPRSGALASGVGVASLLALSEWALPRLAPSQWVAQIGYRQQAALRDTAASVYEVPHLQGGPLEQVWALGEAMATAVLRPGIWEAHAPLAVLAGLENGLLLVVLALAVVRRRLSLDRRALGIAVLVLVCSAAIGLTASNLGTLSRQRSVLVPFVWVLAFAAAGLGQARPGPGHDTLPAGEEP